MDQEQRMQIAYHAENFGPFVRALVKKEEMMRGEITPNESTLLSSFEALFFHLGVITSQAFPHGESYPHKYELIHAILGLNSEIGELIDATKRLVIYRYKIDQVKDGKTILENIIEELGDALFFMEDIITLHKNIDNHIYEDLMEFKGVLLDTISQINLCYGCEITEQVAKLYVVEKLIKRYPQGYSDKSAQARADKA